VGDLLTFIPKTFEYITIESVIHSKKKFFSSVYGFPSAPPGTSQHNISTFHPTHGHITIILVIPWSSILNMDTLLSSLSSRDHPSYNCLDANVNHLNFLSSHHPPYDYFSTVVNNGFSQCISKATRIINKSYSIIDHIRTRVQYCTAAQLVSETIISDISDQFVTLLFLSTEISKHKTRNFSSENLHKF
jgi:hypothetical protein